MRSIAKRTVLGATSALIAALALAGCGSTGSGQDSQPTPAQSSAAATDSFPVTLSSPLGDAVIEEKPERVATWGWSTQDAVLALGVVPVAMPANVYGGNDDGILPWDADKIAELGGESPTLLKGTESGDPNVEEFVAAKPDVILAPYSGLTQEQFDALSQIAPVVAYPDKPWATTWQDQTTIVGKALGMGDEAAQLVKDTNDKVAALAADNPVLQGKTFVYGANNQPEVFNIYRDTDPRVQLLTELGMVVAPSVAEIDPATDENYFFPVAFENLNAVTSDVLVAYFGSQEEADAFVADPLVAAMPQVKAKAFAPIVGESFVMASSAPTVLSIPWMLDQYVPQLAAAAERVA